MTQLQQKIWDACQHQSFVSTDELAAYLSDEDSCEVENAVAQMVDHGALRASVSNPNLMDEPDLRVFSHIRKARR